MLYEYLTKPGHHTYRSPVLGSRKEEIDFVRDKSYSFSCMEVHILIGRLYNPDFIYTIPEDKKDLAEEISKRKFEGYIQKYSEYGFTVDNIVFWNLDEIWNEFETINSYSSWVAIPKVRNHGLIHNGFYLPKYISAYHELMHLEEFKIDYLYNPKIVDVTIVEALPQLRTMILLDEVYKEIFGIPIDMIVGYGKAVTFNNKQIDLGMLVNFYRTLEAKEGSLHQALFSKESIDFLRGI